MKYAPVVIPTLCRSKHFIRLVESLKCNAWAKYTDVYIGLDYPPSEKYRKGWEEICNYIDTSDFSCFASFNVIRHKENLGSMKNNRFLHELMFQKYDRYIRFDDDNEVSPNFLEYMDKCMDKYENDDDVAFVCGYSYPIEWKASPNATVLKQNVNVAVWGVGYWKKKMVIVDRYISSCQMLKDVSKVVRTKSYKRMIDVTQLEYFSAACFTSKIGGNEQLMKVTTDMAMRAYLAVAGKYAISPVISKVKNHGFDGSGLGCQAIDTSINGDTAGTYNYENQPIDISVNFDIIEDTLNDEEGNRDVLNRFDYRSEKQLAKTKRTIFLCEHIGIWAAKLYCNLCFPFDLISRISRKISRR